MGSTPKKAKPSKEVLAARKREHKGKDGVVQAQHQKMAKLAHNLARLGETLAIPKPTHYYFSQGLPHKKQFRTELRKTLSAADTGVTVELTHNNPDARNESYTAKFTLPTMQSINYRVEENRKVSLLSANGIPALKKVLQVVLERMH